MEESEKRTKTEDFLDKLIKEWKRLFSCQQSGVGYYCFNHGRWMDLKEVQALINTMKEERSQIAKDYRKRTERLSYVVSALGKINPKDLKKVEANYKAKKKANKGGAIG